MALRINLTIDTMGLSGCRGSGDFWAASQAAPMRRVNITGGNLTLFNYRTAGPQYASGGFIAGSQTGFAIGCGGLDNAQCLRVHVAVLCDSYNGFRP